MKICTKCKQSKQLTNFSKNKNSKDGLQNWCRQCRSIDHLIHCSKYKVKQAASNAAHYLANKENILAKNQEYYLANKEKEAIRKVHYYALNRIAIDAQRKAYKEKNKEKCRIRQAGYLKKYYHANTNARIARALRVRLNSAVKGKTKAGSAIKDLGCSIDDLRMHFMSKFQPGMSWETHGYYGWHIDHIIPLSSFDLEDPVQCKEACHYTNLQPLWATDNIKKSDKILEVSTSLLEE